MFQVIARTGTISATAAEFNVAPSAISRRLKALEDRLGVQLVQRTTRQMVITEAGEAYLKGASKILGDVESLEGALQAGSATVSGLIRMTAPLSFGLMALPDVIDAFLRLHPGVTIDVHLSDATVDLIAEGFDLALRIGTLSDSSLKARRLCRVEKGIGVAPSFLDAHSGMRTPADLEGLPGCIYTNKANGDVISWTSPDGAHSGHATVATAFRSNNGDLICDMAIRGHGVVCEPLFILNEAFAKGQLVRLFDEYDFNSSDLFAVYPPTHHLPARVRLLIDALAAGLRPSADG